LAQAVGFQTSIFCCDLLSAKESFII